MASLKQMRDALKQLSIEYAKIQTYDSEVEYKTIFDVIKKHQIKTNPTAKKLY